MEDNRLKITILGSGTSTGVPQIGCQCEVCRSIDPHDKRLRQSALVEWRGKRILIDCGPDFRQQILNTGDTHLDALLITHIHYDHIGGLEDLRGFSDCPIYARRDVIDALHQRLSYCFAEHPYPGVPHYELVEINDNEPFDCVGVEVQPIPVMHYKLPIMGFRIGDLAYITDCKTITKEQIERLRGVPVLVLNALRFEEHLSHISLSQALEIIEQIKPGRAVLVHMSHGIGLHAETSKLLPQCVELAYDGMTIIVHSS
ncbi:MAG: MBL fold metallo-hydrolase [Muribaculaceae bacterium]|nr:MBL fold metallo-hydrolase [Muribaculaceae bacterium]